MGYEEKTSWVPGTSFLAMIMVGCVFLHAFRSATATDLQDFDEGADPFTGKRKRAERQTFRGVERSMDASSSPGPGRIAMTEELRPDSKGPAMGKAAPRKPETAPFAWPDPLPVPVRIDWVPPTSMDLHEWRDFRAGLVTDVCRRFGRDSLADVGDAVLAWPELLFDGISSCMGTPSGRVPLRTWEDSENQSVMSRMLDVQPALRHQRISAVFLQQWTDRERKYFADFEDSRANTHGFQARSEGADLRELGIDQRKVLLDSLRRTYLARYKMESGEFLPDDAWACDRWSGLDFAVLPPLVGGLVYFRGLNKRIALGDMALRIAFEPVSEVLHRKHDRAALAALEWTVNGLPFGIIVSAGRHDGQYGMDFVGIGTSIGTARRAVELQYEVAPR